MDHTVVAFRSAMLVALLGVVLLAGAALLASASAAHAAPLYAPETPLAVGPSTQDAPQFCSGGLPLWEDDAAGDWNILIRPALGDLILLPALSDQRHAAGSGQLVVYEDDRNGDWDLYARQAEPFTLPSGDSPELALVTGAGDQTDPSVDSGLVVYEDTAAGNADIALRDVAAGTTRFLTRNRAAQVDPSISGRWVAWADRRNGNWDIYAFDRTTGRVRQLTTSKADQQAPQVGNGRVVYQDRRNGNWDVYEYTLSSGRERRLTSARSDQTAPTIEANWTTATPDVVFVQGAASAADIYLRDGATGAIKPVCTEAGAQTEPVIHGRRIVWTDARSGQPDVYSTELAWGDLEAYVVDTAPPFNTEVVVSGRLSRADPSNVTIRVTGNGQVRTGVTDADGYFRVSAGRVQRKVTLRACYPGDEDHLPLVSDAVVVTPMAALSRPTVVQKSFWTDPGRLPPPIKWAVSGTLRPRHKAGTRAVTLYVSFWNPATDEWKLYRTYRVAVRDSGTVSAYQTVLSLPWTPRQGRIQAAHADTDHAKTLSAFSRTFFPR